MATDAQIIQGESKVFRYNVTDASGTAVIVTGATCTWELSRYPGETAILTKTTADHITASGSTIDVELEPADTLALDGLYSHELTIADIAGNTTKVQGTLLVSTEIQPEPTP